MSRGYAFGGEKARQIKNRIRDITRDALADRLAEHGHVGRAAREVGVSESYGRVLFGEIRRELGWQAV